MNEAENVVDVAIVGAGVSGAYCAYRLSQDTEKSVAVFEAGDRVGGRLWSHYWPEADTTVELGGEGFSPAHANVFGLTVNELELDVHPHGPFNTLNRMFLRNKMLYYPDFLTRKSFPGNGTSLEDAKVRYFVDNSYFVSAQGSDPEAGAAERADPDAITDPFETVATHLLSKYSPNVGAAFGALMGAYGARVQSLMESPEAQENDGQLTAKQAASVMTPEVYRLLAETIEALENATFPTNGLSEEVLNGDRVPAHDLNLWSVVVNDLGQEAYQLFRSAGYDNTSALDFNFVELTQNLLLGALLGIASPNFWTLGGGFDQLPKTLMQRAQDTTRATLHLEQKLTAVARNDETGLITLNFVDPNGVHTTQRARKMIMSAPVGNFDHGVSLDGFDPDLTTQFATGRKSITGIPAGKLYMVYPRPWWTDMQDLDPKGPQLEGFSSTDVPTRAMYYKGYCGDGRRGIMTGALTDSVSADFWTGFLSPNAEMFPGTGDSEAERRTFGAPVHMVSACQGLLKQVHEGVMDGELPDPELALYHEWRTAGGGWSAWKSGRNIHEEAARLRLPFTKPDMDQGLYCCGDSVAERHGWVENTIQSAEFMLREAFGLKTARWLPGDEVF